MVESTPRTGEAAAGQLLDALLRWRCRLAFVFQGQYQNALEAPHVDQVEAERSGAGGIQPLGCITLGQAQQALALPHLGPRERRIQQALGELTDLRAKCHGLADEAVWCAHGVGGALGRVVIRIGRAATLGLAWMDFDECASFVELDQVAIAARLKLRAGRAGRRRRRVQRVLDADVVIRMNGDVFPERHVVGDAVVRQQKSAFLVFEDHQWQLVRGAVVALAGDLQAPPLGLAACVDEVDERAAFPEAAACVLNESFDLGFVFRLSAIPPEICTSSKPLHVPPQLAGSGC